eukprot:scaffold91_cov127-Cylindrotheca_fusiformis.AAC.28
MVKSSRKRPAPGDPDYKTPTQLRNARKRKKAKKEKRIPSSETQHPDPGDPSLRYLSNPTAAPTVQRAISFFKKHKKTFDVTVGPLTGWRTVSKLAVRSLSGVLHIGLFAPGSHDVLEIPECQAHHPRINSAIQVIRKECRKASIKPFDEKTGKGSLKHIAINIERSTGTQQVTLVWNDAIKEDKKSSNLQKLCETIIRTSRSGDKRLKLHSLWVHFSKSNKHSNSIFDRGGKWEKVYGEAMVVEYLPIDGCPTVPLHFPPQVFRQANLDAFANIVVKIRHWLQSHRTSHCVELYGGVGTIGLHLADLCDSFVSSDENPFNKNCFEKTVSLLATTKYRSVIYESKNAIDMTRSLAFRQAEAVVVDPPRKGLDSEVVEALCAQEKLQTLVYVSCGFDAFTRDFECLTHEGSWRLEHAEGHVLFPGSDAIETIAFFSRQS